MLNIYIFAAFGRWFISVLLSISSICEYYAYACIHGSLWRFAFLYPFSFFSRLLANQPASHQTRKYTFKRSLKYFLIGILFPFSFLYTILCLSCAWSFSLHIIRPKHSCAHECDSHMKSFNVLCIGFNLRYYLIISFVDCFLHFAYQCMSNSCTYSYARRAILLFFVFTPFRHLDTMWPSLIISGMRTLLRDFHTKYSFVLFDHYDTRFCSYV